MMACERQEPGSVNHTCRFHIFRSDMDDHLCQWDVYIYHSNKWQILLHNRSKIDQPK
jgi:hypothetical protein